MVFFLCDEDYLASTCTSVVRRERVYTRDEGSRTFGRHKRVKFEIKSGSIYFQSNHTGDIKYQFLYDKHTYIQVGSLVANE